MEIGARVIHKFEDAVGEYGLSQQRFGCTAVRIGHRRGHQVARAADDAIQFDRYAGRRSAAGQVQYVGRDLRHVISAE
jgi:hypothetical protein